LNSKNFSADIIVYTSDNFFEFASIQRKIALLGQLPGVLFDAKLRGQRSPVASCPQAAEISVPRLFLINTV
jgi:hypothetical protein